MRQATREYRVEMDVLAGFLADCCEVGTRERAYARELYGTYKRWCKDTGEEPESQKKFGGRLKERGFLNDRDSRTGRTMWSGLSINDEWELRAEGSLNLSDSGFAGQNESPEPFEPKNSMNGLESHAREVIREKGSEDSEGSEERERAQRIDTNCFSSQAEGVMKNSKEQCVERVVDNIAGDVPPELAAYFADPPGWLIKQAHEVRQNPGVLKPTCSTIAYELYGYGGRGAEIEAAVAEWIAGDLKEQG